MGGRFAYALGRGSVTVIAAALVSSRAHAADADFNRDVLPILTTNCFPCHGPDPQKRKAGLRLDTREGAVAAVVLPGKPDKSELIGRITADDEGRMPPHKHGPRLAPEQVQILRAWIERGAAYTEHWGFVPPKRPEVPKTRYAAANPIDAFILAQLEKQGLKPAPKAAREVLIRRATLDLTGLPPTPEEVDAFLKDDSPGAWAKVVDRLLASEHYGERWGRHWLDVAR